MSDAFTPSVSIPRWLLFSKLPQIFGPTTWAVLIALVFTVDRLLRMRSPQWAVDDEFGYFKVRVRAEIPAQTGLCHRSVQRAMDALKRAKIIDVIPGEPGVITQVCFEKKTIEALARYCLPRLPGYQGGIAGKTKLQDRLTLFVGNRWGWSRETAEQFQKQEEGKQVSINGVCEIITRQGGTLPNQVAGPFGE